MKFRFLDHGHTKLLLHNYFLLKKLINKIHFNIKISRIKLDIFKK